MKFKGPPQGDPGSEPVERDDVRLAANRCPYCHDDVPRQLGVACQVCLARHHPDCWEEGGACAACSATERLVREESSTTRGRGVSRQITQSYAALAAGFLVSAPIAFGLEVGASLGVAGVFLLISTLWLVTLAGRPRARRSTVGSLIAFNLLNLIPILVALGTSYLGGPKLAVGVMHLVLAGLSGGIAWAAHWLELGEAGESDADEDDP